MIRKAAGVFEYLAGPNMVPACTILVFNPSVKELPELAPQACQSLTNYATAMAQIVSVHHANATSKTFGVSAKLAIAAYKALDVARSKNNSIIEQLQKQVFTENYRAVIAQQRILYRAEALYHLAKDANKHQYVFEWTNILC